MNNSGNTPRSYMYRLLSIFFAKELSPENIKNIQSGETSQLMEALEGIEAYAPIMIRLKEYFAEMTDLNHAALDLAESYAWLFHGVAGPPPAPLSSSVYLSPNGNILQEPEAEFYTLLQKYQLSSKTYANEPCDHLSVILEFISRLDEQAETAENPGPWIQEQKTAIEKHLLSWLPDFATRCRQGDNLGFYADLAKDTLAFVTEDNRQLSLVCAG